MPDSKEMDSAYECLTRMRLGKSVLLIQDWIRLSRYSRFDSRLAELYVQAISRSFRKIDPIAMNEANLSIASPGVLGVLLEHAEGLAKDPSELEQFRLWKKLALFKTPHGNHEQFFIGTRGFGTSHVRAEAEKSLKHYKKWGYLGSEVLRNKFKLHQAEHPKTYLDASTRRTILQALLKSKLRFTVEDYIDACGNAISRRSAQLDLSKEPHLKSFGQTRARIYQSKANRTSK